MHSSLQSVAGRMALCATVMVAASVMVACATAQQPPAGTPPPKSPPQYGDLKAVQLPKEIFTPTKGWKFDGTELYDRVKARFSRFAFAQMGTYSVGGKSVLNSGATVQYGVIRCKDVAAAKTTAARNRPRGAAAANVVRVVRPIVSGDGGSSITDTLTGRDGSPVSSERRASVRYGRFVIQVIGRSDMKTFGPRPAKGARAWLYEPVFEKVMAEATRRWSQQPRKFTGSS